MSLETDAQAPFCRRASSPIQAGSRLQNWLFWRVTLRHFRSCLFSELPDNVAAQEAASHGGGLRPCPENPGWRVYEGVTTAQALLKADMRC